MLPLTSAAYRNISGMWTMEQILQPHQCMPIHQEVLRETTHFIFMRQTTWQTRALSEATVSELTLQHPLHRVTLETSRSLTMTALSLLYGILSQTSLA